MWLRKAGGVGGGAGALAPFPLKVDILYINGLGYYCTILGW